MEHSGMKKKKKKQIPIRNQSECINEISIQKQKTQFPIYE